MKAKRIKIDVTEKEFESILYCMYMMGFDHNDRAHACYKAGDKPEARMHMARSKKYDKLGKKISDKARFA